MKESYNGKVTALASYPRSGNTWIRTLIEKATGVQTSSLYCDKHLRKTFRSECDKKAKFLVKTHYPVNFISHTPEPQDHFRRFDRAIHLIRNPFDAIISYHNFHQAGRKSFNHTYKMERFELSNEKLQWYISKYESHFKYWYNVPIRTLLVRYEDLRQWPDKVLKQVVDFLFDSTNWSDTFLGENPSNMDIEKLSVTDEMIQCAVNDGRVPYFSSTAHERFLYGIQYFTNEQLEMIISQLSLPICKCGYHEIFPRWLMNITSFENSDKVNILNSLDCKSLETVVDFANNTKLMEYSQLT